MRRLPFIGFAAVVTIAFLALPVILHETGSPICVARISAQDNPCLEQKATISALQLENLQLQLTNEALIANPSEIQAIETVIVIVTATPNDASAESLPPTVTITPGGAVLVEPAPQYEEVNIRANPDLNAELVGTMQADEQFEVIGRFFRWIQIAYPDAEDGTAWVFESVVAITGDYNTVPEVIPDNFQTIRIVEIAGIGNQSTEAVRLQNGGDTVEITGWILANTTTGERYAFPQLLFFSGSQIVVNTRTGDDFDNLLYWGADMPIWSVGDILTLSDTDGNVLIELTISE